MEPRREVASGDRHAQPGTRSRRAPEKVPVEDLDASGDDKLDALSGSDEHPLADASIYSSFVDASVTERRNRRSRSSRGA
jgi:hypothetical protein